MVSQEEDKDSVKAGAEADILLRTISLATWTPLIWLTERLEFFLLTSP